jgi:ATP:corrinoid adenosyltransferase
MTASDEQAHNALHQARLLRRKAVADAKIAGASRDQGALPDLIALADTVTEMRVIKHASGIRAQKSIEL